MSTRTARAKFDVERVITYHPSYLLYCKVCNFKEGPYDYRSNALQVGFEHVESEHSNG